MNDYVTTCSAILLIFNTVCFRSDAFILDLSGKSQWSLSNNNQTIKVPGSVPGGVYSDLYNAKVISDPFYRFNDTSTRWVAREDWTYYREFEVTEEFVRKTKLIVVLDGVDTIAAVHVNGQGVGNCNNMFQRFQFDIWLYLKVGKNNISVSIYSPLEFTKHAYALQLVDYVVPPVCVPPEYHGECHVNMIRKMQASYGWDFGPAFPSLGLWKAVRLEGFDVVMVRNVMVDVELQSDGNWKVILRVLIESADLHQKVFTLMVDVEGVGSVEERVILAPDITLMDNFTYQFITQEPPQLWWPSGYGDQRLYAAKVSAVTMSEESVKTVYFGFRTVKLLQEPVGNNTGLTFAFEINGIQIFLKGSNWIPAHILPEQSTPERTNYLLKAAKEANMNCLRVWGGGTYESEEFYYMADRLGIMIWQDFMFACSMYPTRTEFIRTVESEVQYQVRRLQHHPSIIVWAANNENEAALRGNWYGTKRDFELYHKDYVKLYVDTVRRSAQEIDPSRPFLVSSPTNGKQSEEESFVAQNPYSTHFGDVHFYDYDHDMWDPKNYPNPRMCSEYGIQSLPSVNSFQNQFSDDDLYFESPLLSNRQHHPLGNFQLWNQVFNHFLLPRNLRSKSGFKNFIYLTQIHQAMGIKLQTEAYRRYRSVMTKQEEGLTMGALYWQLNDLWAAPSWASIEYTGKWKLLQYYAKKFFSPLLLSPVVNDGSVEVFGVSDLLTSVDLTATLQVYHWDSFKPALTLNFNATMTPLSSKVMYDTSLSGILKKAKCLSDHQKIGLLNNEILSEPDGSQCFLIVSATSESFKGDIFDNFLLFGPPKNSFNMLPSQIKIVRVAGPTKTKEGFVFQLTLATDNIAPFVLIDTYSVFGTFSDNGFIMYRGEYELMYTTAESVSNETLAADIRVTSLMDIYHDDSFTNKDV